MGPEAETIAAAAPRPARKRGALRFLPPAARTAAVDASGIDEALPNHDIRARETVYRRLLGLADLFGSAIAIVLVVDILGDDTLRWWALLTLPLIVLVAKVGGLYDRDALLINKTTLDEAPKLFQVATLFTLLVLITQHSFVIGGLSPIQTVGLWGIFFATAVTGRWMARSLAGRVVGAERVLVIGGVAEAARVAGKFAEDPSVNATVVGRVPLSPADPHRHMALGALADLQRLVREHGVHRAMVAPGDTSYDDTLIGIRAAKAVGVQVSVLPRLLEVVGSSVEFDQLSGMSVLGVRRFGLTTSSALIKRATDVLGAALGLLVLAPAFAVIAALVKRSSPGPVFFRQERVGQDGRPFELIKFRTMVADAEARRAELLDRNEAADGLFKIADDPRITPIGRFLRRTSLDELPQLLNVLRGDMSLVGPRPLVEEEDGRIEGQHRRRLHLKPGMTGHWQISGSSKIPLREMVTIDYLYVANWSLWGDIKILCRTVPYVLARRGL